ncbi:ATP synthase F0 sector subunit b' (EC [Olavius algarvensis Delta 1 endosymbiont]|nr:ATP synthase F0 sector subunit b' (EC [Olavius algarvensis Delta 1 endosymbiont]
MEIISNIALISINETLIVQVIGFLIFLFIINRIMFRPLRNVMADRDIYVERVKLDIDQARKKVDTMNSQIEEQEAEVRKEAFELKEQREQIGSQQAKEIFAAVRQEIADTSAGVQKDIDQKIAEARNSLQKESEALAERIVEKILDRRQQP